MKVVLRTDMLTLTTPLEQYLTEHVGSLDTTSPDLWAVYTAGLDELYAAAPSLDGVLVRIGEAGRVYDVDGWDYYSSLAVTTVDAVRAMLTALTGQAERTGRDVIFRSWSVGVGAVGDMHTNPDSYAAVLDGIDSPALVVSTKYTLGDFYSHLPLNETLLSGSQRRIVEFQSRREFESYGAFPNDLGAEYRDALQRLLAANPHIEGVWAWTQDGGPWRAGPMTLYLKAGFWQLYELNTVLAGSLARDPDADVGALTADWARRWFSDDPATVRAVTEAMAGSREAVTKGLYIGPFAEQKVRAIGLEPPPMMWIFEWDILTGDSAVLDVISSVTGDRVDEAVTEGREAVATAERMRTLVAGTDPATWRDPAMREAFLGTLDYEVDTLGLLAEYRELVLRQGQWHATGSSQARDQWSAALERYRGLAASHLERYQGDVDHPAYNLTAAELGIARSERDPAMAWLARGLLALAVGWLVAGAVVAFRRRGEAPRSAAAASWVAATRPWRAAEVGPGMPRLQRVLLVAVPGVLLLATRAVQTSFLAPVHLLVVLGAWLVLVGVGCGAAARPGALGRGRGCGRRAGGALCARPAGDVVHRPGRLLVRVLDRARPAHRLRHRRRGPVPVAARGHRLGALGHRGAPPGSGDRARRGRRRAGGAGLRHRGGRSRARAHGVERPGRAAAVGALPDPRDHGLPRHPRGHRVVGRRGGCRGVRRGSAARAPGAAAPATSESGAQRPAAASNHLSTRLTRTRGQRRPPPRMPPSTSPMMLPASNPPADPPPDPAEPPTREPAALPSTSRSRSSSEPGVLPPPPPGSAGEVSAGWPAVPPPRPPPPPLSTRLASQESTIGARIGSSFLTRSPPKPEPPTAGSAPSRLTTSSSWSPKMWLAMAVPSCSSMADRSAPPVSRSSSCWPRACRIDPAPDESPAFAWRPPSSAGSTAAAQVRTSSGVAPTCCEIWSAGSAPRMSSTADMRSPFPAWRTGSAASEQT